MAGNPSIVVRIAANVRDFLAGTNQVEDALDDLATESGDLARDVEQDTDRMVRAFRDAGRKIDTTTRDAGRDAKENLGDTGREIGSETAANIAEGIGSGKVDVRDALLGTIGGIVPALSPAFAGIALAGGTAVAAMLAKIDAQKEKAKAAGVAFFDAYRDGLIESSEREGLLIAALGAEDYQDALIRIGDIARESGVPVEELVEALTTGRKSFAVTEALERAARAAERTDKALNRPGVGRGRSEEVKAAVKIAEAYERTANALDRAVEARKTLAQVPTSGFRLPASTPTRPGGGQRTPTTRGQLP